MKTNLRLERVLIGRKRSSLHQDLVASCRRAIERRHHQVQVYRQRIHYDDFRRICPHELRSLLRQQSVIREPRILPSEVALYAQFRPVAEFLLHVCSVRSWVEVRGNARRDKCTPVRLVLSECETGRGNVREDRAHPFRARILRCSDMNRGSRGLQCGQLSPDQDGPLSSSPDHRGCSHHRRARPACDPGSPLASSPWHMESR